MKQKRTSASSGADTHIFKVRHSLSHLLATAVLETYPKTKLAIGPVIENGFYYDFDFKKPISDTDLVALEKRMHELIAQRVAFKKTELTPAQARKAFKEAPYKLELVQELIRGKKKITQYTSGSFTDLCSGPHVRNTSEINPDGFKLTRLAGAYWRGDEKNKMLTRIYGLAFETKEELDAYIKNLEEAEKRDHKKLGKDLDLFIIDEKIGKGLPLWTPKGTALKFELEKFTRELERKYGYEHVCTPYLGAEALYKTSGHLDHYSKNMYAPIDMDGDLFYLRPMACPHHIRMYQRRPWSYKELPVRYAEIADYNRYEKSGELMGMIRVRKFQLTDGHIFVTPEGLKDEFKNVCRMIVEGTKGLGLLDIVSYRFSKRDPKNKEKYYPDNALWNHSEKLMKEALDELGLSYVEALDEAAFYGPKLDVQAKNVNGKEDTLFTAQMDFLLPKKFDMEYVDQNGEKKRPVMIHRSTIGCLERTFAFLIEHYAGAFPVWLSPTQAVVIPVSDKHADYAQRVVDDLRARDVRVVLFGQNETLGKRIREAELQKIPYLVVVGDKEKESKQIAVRSRSSKDTQTMSVGSFIDIISEQNASHA